MSPEELEELKNAATSHAQQDAHGGRLFHRLVAHIAALDERIKRLEKPKKPAPKSEEGV